MGWTGANTRRVEGAGGTIRPAYPAPTTQAGAWFLHASYALRSTPPEILKAVRRQGRVDRGAGDRPMAERSLDRPRVVALISEG